MEHHARHAASLEDEHGNACAAWMAAMGHDTRTTLQHAFCAVQSQAQK
jgi:hypothetical protein